MERVALQVAPGGSLDKSVSGPSLLKARHFEQVKKLLYEISGIDLKKGKEALVKARLDKRLRALGMDDYDTYLKYVEQDQSGSEIIQLVDALTTNKTSFFREIQHFDFLQRELLPRWRGRPLRFWSAACSSGEEPYSLALLLCQEIPDIGEQDVRILATDISDTALEKARQARYPEEGLKEVPPALRRQYFVQVQPGIYQLDDSVRRLVRFARLNLMGRWPMRGPFDVIFCRNVMIYFNRETRRRLVHRFYRMIRPGGYLFIGHSESLTGFSHPYRYVQPAIYQRE